MDSSESKNLHWLWL